MRSKPSEGSAMAGSEFNRLRNLKGQMNIGIFVMSLSFQLLCRAGEGIRGGRRELGFRKFSGSNAEIRSLCAS